MLRIVISLVVFNFFSISNSYSQQKKYQSISANKPNILMILIDDFGWRDLHSYGSEFYETPAMDKLVSQSLKFTQAYSTYPRCVPSRYSIMTGSHPARLKGDGEGNDGEKAFTVNAPNISIGQAMKENGYNTFYVGKWHLGANNKAPNSIGFDQSIAANNAGATSSHFAPYNVSRGGASGKETPLPDLDNAKEGENLEDRLTQEYIQLLAQNASNGKPFFGILAHYAVHTPIQGKDEYFKYFQAKLKNNPQTGSDFEPQSAGENKLKQDNAMYAAMIKSVDDGIGKILEKITELGISKNTIIIVTSDHGGLSSRGNNRVLATSNKPLRAGKGHLYEGGIRVPLFIKWPGVTKPGSETNSIVQGLDLFSTIVDMAAGKMPTAQQSDGVSFINIIKGNNTKSNRSFYWHNAAPRPTQTGDIYSSAIRKGDFKLIDFYALNKMELYNLRDDIGENNNIIGKYPELVKELYNELDSWRKKIGADMKIKKGSLSKDENFNVVQ